MHRLVSRAPCSVLAGMALALLLAACPLLPGREGSDVLRDLERSQQRWRSRDIADYRYVVQRSCFCGGEVVRAVVVEVRGGEVTSRRYRDESTPLAWHDPTLWPSVEGLFELVRDAVERGADRVEVDYHPEHGYPVSIRIDEMLRAVDDELTITASGLERL